MLNKSGLGGWMNRRCTVAATAMFWCLTATVATTFAGDPPFDDCNGNQIPDECDINNDTCNFSTNCLNFDPHCGIPDCNNNLIPDVCDISSGTATDCNGNSVPDSCDPFIDCNGNDTFDACDIAEGTSNDCNGNDVPDECDPDCNGNNLPDDCEDCDGNAIPDECDMPDFAQNADCSTCCPIRLVAVCGQNDDCDGNSTLDSCDIAQNSTLDCNGNSTLDECEDCDGDAIPDDCEINPNTSESCFFNCCGGNGVRGGGTILPDCVSQDTNQNTIPDDCEDCNGNEIPDTCDINNATCAESTECTQFDGACQQADCNGNSVIDSCEIAEGTARDCNGNDLLDSCEDCNSNGIPDRCDLTDFADAPECAECCALGDARNGACGEASDCDGNSTLDSCDINQDSSIDCNFNGIIDECEDCNGNAIPDECEFNPTPNDEACFFGCCARGERGIVAGVCDAEDCNGNKVPDECEEFQDCNGNSVPDVCDVNAGDQPALPHIATVGINCSGSDGPYWLGVDGSSSHLFVLSDSRCEGNNYGIHVYNIVAGGNDLVFNQTLFGSEGASSDCYGALTVSESTDRLFAIDYCSDTVHIYDAATLASLGTVPAERAGEVPLMVSVGHFSGEGGTLDDQVFISDADTLRISDIATLGVVSDHSVTLGTCSTPGSGFDCPGFDDGKHMVVDSLGQRIFVSDHDNPFIVFDFSSPPVQIFPTFGADLCEPLGIAPLPDGKILITDEDDCEGGLFRLNSDLSLDVTADVPADSGCFEYTPEGVVYDAVHDRIYVADEDCDEIEIFGFLQLSQDCNNNSIPDECEPDCNGNSIADECDIRAAGGNTLYGSQGGDTCYPFIYTIDPVSGVATEFVDLDSFDFDTCGLTGLALSADGSTLYVSNRYDPVIFLIDTQTASASSLVLTVQIKSSIVLSDIALLPDGTMIGSDPQGRRLWNINLLNGEATPRCSTFVSVFKSDPDLVGLSGLTTAADGTVYGSTGGGQHAVGRPGTLFHVNTDTCELTPIGTGTGFPKVPGLTFTPDGRLLGSTGFGSDVRGGSPELIEIDTTTGVGTLVTIITDNSLLMNIDGLAFSFGGGSDDCNRNGIPDECEADCNGNSIADDCEIQRSRGPIVYFVFETSNQFVYRLQDLNGDGDANDPGEGWIYGRIEDVEGLDVDQRNGDLYTSEEGPMLIYRYRDLNGDGDALDPGEKFLYGDDNGVGVDDIENIAFDESSNTVYTVFEDEDLIVWHRDNNGDGDALDEGERGIFAHVGSDLEAIAVDASTGDVYVGDGDEDDVWRIVDVNGDGDALDAEDIIESVGQLGHEAVDFNDNTGELFAGEEDFDHFHRLVGGVENEYGQEDCCAEALAVDPITGAVFTGDEPFDRGELAGYCGLIWKYSDLNGDGDALDDTERTFFHDFLFNQNSECETEGLAVYGGRDLDADGDEVLDECVEALTCPTVDLVVVMDTSGSMEAEAAVLCAQINGILNGLTGAGIGVNVTLLGITEAPGGPFSCLSDDVVNLFGAAVPGSPACCPNVVTKEDWGLAVPIVAANFPWTLGSTRAVLVVSDEGPEGGDPCEDPGNDRAVITNAIDVANANDVFVATLTGDGVTACVTALAADLAAATGGAAAGIDDPLADLANAMSAVIAAICTGAVDFDRDGAGIADECPNDPSKASPGVCGCGVPDTDSNDNGIPDCIDDTGTIVPDPACALCGAVGVAFYFVTLTGYALLLFTRRRRR